MRSLTDLLLESPGWEHRWDVLAYVDRCETAGFCTTDDQRRACAERYLIGKRRVTPPGTERRKKDAKQQQRLLANVPVELLTAIRLVVIDNLKTVEQFKKGNDKALNALVGGVMKRSRSDPQVIRALLLKEIAGEH